MLVVFFTSKMWMYDDNPIVQTPFQSPITGLDQTTLQLNKWEYNPEEELMEVSLETIHKGSDIVKPTFTFSAREKGEIEEYPVKIVYKDDDNIVVQIENVSDKFKIIGLIVREHRDEKVLKSELKEKALEHEGIYDQDGSDSIDEKLTLPKPSEKILVGDYRKIKTNEKLVTRGAIDYQIENVEREIKQLEKQIKIVVEEKIPLQEELVQSLENEIIALEAELEYETKEEQQETLGEIQAKKDAILDANKSQDEHSLVVEKLMEKHERLRAKLDSIRAEKRYDLESDVVESEAGEGEERGGE